jgi:hypothetical protein
MFLRSFHTPTILSITSTFDTMNAHSLQSVEQQLRAITSSYTLNDWEQQVCHLWPYLRLLLIMDRKIH